jgi:beta-phosphoglucomutase-like phosphatase (HAD superfamily)
MFASHQGGQTAALQMGTAILDIDGTLVDTNYHHTLSWTTSADVDQTKPAPDLVDAALNAVHGPVAELRDQLDQTRLR